MKVIIAWNTQKHLLQWVRSGGWGGGGSAVLTYFKGRLTFTQFENPWSTTHVLCVNTGCEHQSCIIPNIKITTKTHQSLDGPERLQQSCEKLSSPLIGQQTQAGLGESFLGHTQLPVAGATEEKKDGALASLQSMSHRCKQNKLTWKNTILLFSCIKNIIKGMTNGKYKVVPSHRNVIPSACQLDGSVVRERVHPNNVNYLLALVQMTAASCKLVWSAVTLSSSCKNNRHR